jgi:hypothetical protein
LVADKEAMTTTIACSSYKSVLVIYEHVCRCFLFIDGQRDGSVSTASLALGGSMWNWVYTWKVESSHPCQFPVRHV